MKHAWGIFVLVGAIVALHYTMLSSVWPAAAEAGSQTTNTRVSAQSQGQRERLYFATGEYDCKRTWDALIRIDDISDATNVAEPYTEDAAIPVKQLSDDEGISLNFVHNIYVDEMRNEMYVASLFTGITETIDICDTRNMDLHTGSVAVISNIRQADDSTTTVSRHIYGDETGLEQPHGIWLDHTNELLYIANTHGGDIRVYENAYSVDGNAPPDRIITSPLMKAPTHIFVDEASDRMFVTNFGGELLGLDPNVEYEDDGTLPSVLIFDDASELVGDVEPDIRIVDDDGRVPDPTRLREGVAHITHNVWFDSVHNLVFVVHHTNEVLVFDMDRIGTTPPAGCLDQTRCAMRPKAVIEVGQDSASEYYSSYGLFYRAEEDRLYVTVGRTDADPGSELGYEIVEGVPPNVILVYDNVSTFESFGPTQFEPSREIYWQSGQEQYYPPQPLWVTVEYPTFLPAVLQ